MAHLIKNRLRLNPATGKKEVYYLLQERGRPAVALGFVDSKTADEALVVYRAQLIQERRAGALPATSQPSASPPPPARPPTLAEWWGANLERRFPDWPDCKMLQYLRAQGLVGDALRTWADSRRVIVAELGHVRLDEVTVDVGDAFIARMRARPTRQGARPKDRTLQIRIGHLQNSLDVAVEYGVLASAPRLRRPAVKDQAEGLFLTPEQARVLVAELARRRQAEIIDGVTHLAIVAGLTLGLRPSELLSRRWCDIDWTTRTLYIREAQLPDGTWWRPKTERSRRPAPIPDDLFAILREEWMRQGRGAGWMFPARDNPDVPRGSYRRALASATAAAGLPELHPYALRHSAATAQAWAGASIRDLMDFGGWSSEKMPARVYLHTTAQRLRALANAASPLSADQPPLTSVDTASEASIADPSKRAVNR